MLPTDQEPFTNSARFVARHTVESALVVTRTGAHRRLRRAAGSRGPCTLSTTRSSFDQMGHAWTRLWFASDSSVRIEDMSLRETQLTLHWNEATLLSNSPINARYAGSFGKSNEDKLYEVRLSQGESQSSPNGFSFLDTTVIGIQKEIKNSVSTGVSPARIVRVHARFCSERQLVPVIDRRITRLNGRHHDAYLGLERIAMKRAL